MILDLDMILNQIGEALSVTFRELEEGKPVRRERVYGDDRSVKVTTRVSIGPLVPDIAPLPRPPEKEPLIEVFDDAKGLRILVELPGVRTEDVRVRLLDGILRIEVTKAGKVHRKDIPCRVVPGSIEIKSSREKNSVVELTFLRKNRE